MSVARGFVALARSNPQQVRPIGARDNMSNLVRVSGKAASGFDPTVYPVEEKGGEDLLQRWIVELLRPLLERWLSSRGVQALVGADQFIYYRQHMPTQRVSPDIYVLPGVSPTTRVTSWKIWCADGVSICSYGGDGDVASSQPPAARMHVSDAAGAGMFVAAGRSLRGPRSRHRACGRTWGRG